MVGSSWVMTLAEGNYEFSISMKGFISTRIVRQVTALNASNKKNWKLTLSPTMKFTQWRFVLTWGASPKDLDTWFVLFRKGIRTFKIFFDPDSRTDPKKIANLDVDNTEGFGPETLTVDLAKMDNDDNGAYIINNFSKIPLLHTSNAKVIVYNGDLKVREYTCPSAPSPEKYWYVANLNKDGLQDVNKMVHSAALINTRPKH